jgi:hypothetical protein
VSQGTTNYLPPPQCLMQTPLTHWPAFSDATSSLLNAHVSRLECRAALCSCPGLVFFFEREREIEDGALDWTHSSCRIQSTSSWTRNQSKYTECLPACGLMRGMHWQQACKRYWTQFKILGPGPIWIGFNVFQARRLTILTLHWVLGSVS